MGRKGFLNNAIKIYFILTLKAEKDISSLLWFNVLHGWVSLLSYFPHLKPSANYVISLKRLYAACPALNSSTQNKLATTIRAESNKLIAFIYKNHNLNTSAYLYFQAVEKLVSGKLLMLFYFTAGSASFFFVSLLFALAPPSGVKFLNVK